MRISLRIRPFLAIAIALSSLWLLLFALVNTGRILIHMLLILAVMALIVHFCEKELNETWTNGIPEPILSAPSQRPPRNKYGRPRRSQSPQSLRRPRP